MNKKQALNMYMTSVVSTNTVPTSITELGELINTYYESKNSDAVATNYIAYANITLALRYYTFFLAKRINFHTDRFERVINAIYVYLVNRLNEGKLVNINTLESLVGEDFETVIMSEVNNTATVDNNNVKKEKIKNNRYHKIMGTKSAYKLNQDVKVLRKKSLTSK